MIYCELFKNILSFSMTPTKLLTVLTKKAMIFLKMVDEIHTKFFEMHVKYSVAMKTSFYSSDLLPIFLKYLVICNDFNKACDNVNERSNDFLHNCRLNSRKIPWNARKVQCCNVKKLLF